MDDEDMCDNCVTPWKCNGPHCWCGANGGEGCYCCTDECPDDCMADHKGEQ